MSHQTAERNNANPMTAAREVIAENKAEAEKNLETFRKEVNRYSVECERLTAAREGMQYWQGMVNGYSNALWAIDYMTTCHPNAAAIDEIATTLKKYQSSN